jgi:hypothetical protein
LLSLNDIAPSCDRRFDWPVVSAMRAFLTVACLSVVCACCTRVDPPHTPVEARDVTAFSTWQRNVASHFPPELQQGFADALQEIRYLITAQNEATGHDAIAAALCRHIDARTVNTVLLTGYNLKLQRLAAERDALQQTVNKNAHLITKPGDRTAADYLDQFRAGQQQRLDTIKAEMQRAETLVLALGGVPRPRRPDADAAAPLSMASREEALRQIAVMMQERRNVGIFKFGEWPVRIDREGRQLNDAQRGDFLARKVAAESGGRVIIPIRIKGHWLFFEGPDEAPPLPEFIRANLTAADRRKFQADWVNLEAELWARKSAADLELQKPTVVPPQHATAVPDHRLPPMLPAILEEAPKIPPPTR